MTEGRTRYSMSPVPMTRGRNIDVYRNNEWVGTIHRGTSTDTWWGSHQSVKEDNQIGPFSTPGACLRALEDAHEPIHAEVAEARIRANDKQVAYIMDLLRMGAPLGTDPFGLGVDLYPPRVITLFRLFAQGKVTERDVRSLSKGRASNVIDSLTMNYRAR